MQITTNFNSFRYMYMPNGEGGVRSPQVMPNQNDLQIPNLANFPASVTNAHAATSQHVQMPSSVKRNVQLSNVKMQQFPPVGSGVLGSQALHASNESNFNYSNQSQPMYTAQVLKARQSIGKRSQNISINDGGNLPSALTPGMGGKNQGQILRTIDLSQTISAEGQPQDATTSINSPTGIGAASSKQSVANTAFSQGTTVGGSTQKRTSNGQ